MTIAEKLQTIAENEQKVYGAGEQAEYDGFWDAFQQNGARESYSYGFAGHGWTDKTFKPKHNIKPNIMANMFYASRIEGDLVEILESLGVSLDTSKATSISNAFSTCRLSRIGIVDATGVTSTLQTVFSYAEYLQTIDKLILKADGSNVFNQAFVGAVSLANLTIEGVIGSNGFNVQWSPLTHDSLMSIVNALQDKTADTSDTTWTITLGTNNLSKLTAEEKAIIERKGWVYA